MRRAPGGPGRSPALPVVRRRRRRSLPARAYLRLREVHVGLRTVAFTLIGLGVITCLVPFAILGYGMWEENQLTQRWASDASTVPEGPRADVAGPSDAPTVPPTAQARHTPSIPAVFAMRVPKIGYYAAVREGVSNDILAVGPGHYPSSAMPGRPGLVGIAAHNTFWIPFGKLGPGDSVVLETRGGKYTYDITGTRVVAADDRTALAGTPDNRLALTTCWPLWAGNLAPQRLVLYAQQV